MKTTVFVILVFTTFNSKIETHKFTDKIVNNVTVTQHFLDSSTAKDTKVINNETILTDNRKKTQVKIVKEDISVNNYVLYSDLTNKNENTDQSKTKVTNKRPIKMQPKIKIDNNNVTINNDSINTTTAKDTKMENNGTTTDNHKKTQVKEVKKESSVINNELDSNLTTKNDNTVHKNKKFTNKKPIKNNPKSKLVNNETTNYGLINTKIARDTKVINNETILTEIQKKTQVKGESSVINNMIDSDLTNKKENTEQSKKKLGNKKPLKKKFKSRSRNKTKPLGNRLKNDRGRKNILYMSSIVVNECSSGKERADDGSCVSVEIALDSDEIIDIEINVTPNATISEAEVALRNNSSESN